MFPRICLFAFCTFLSVYAAAANFPSYGYKPPADWQGDTFQLSQAYPASAPATSPLPWEKIDFRAEPEKYIWAVMNYSYEGNLPIDFVVQKNTVRGWYHAPWLHAGTNGREFVRGLTRERTSRPYELSPTQTRQYNNYAVGFYNDRGGWTIGKVWSNPTKPDVSNVNFPEGTVSFKLLFTTAPDSAVSYLQGSPEWAADINRAPSAAQILNTKVRLLQIDIAVKDRRADKGGWVFGTLHYDAAISNPNPWLRLRPLTLMWGDDPGLTETIYNGGKKPVESWINQNSPIVQYRSNPPQGTTPPRTMGWAGRGNGPVDNPVSSCMSCHGTAQIPARSPMIPPNNLSEPDKLKWFRNTKPNESFDVNSASLDYSLQLGVGIQNLVASQKPPAGPASTLLKDKAKSEAKIREYRFSRDGS